MAGFTLKDITIAKGVEEEKVKVMVAEAWELMKKVNWDARKFCLYNPKERVNYPISRSFKSYMESEGWDVVIIEEPNNFKFQIYRPLDAQLA